MPQEKISPRDLRKNLDALNRDCPAPWEIVDDKLHKTFVFKDFIEAFGFMTKAAIAAEKMNHHPEWSNVYKTVRVALTTHESGGITRLDFDLAERMEILVARACA